MAAHRLYGLGRPDLLFHCLMDCRRGLVALHTPAPGPVDRDAVTYWIDWRPGTEGAANGQRPTSGAGHRGHVPALRPVARAARPPTPARPASFPLLG
ncbi:hypothetical protein OG444_39635 [Streptomyces sp. NBC_01232]|uniref:hypothetical protein n=1 Tax=Streptomyces sp. NBC_01232 TaxID=2903786 RepID=UPI002E15B753|nr:hypothetical protein OG444_00195 [Streptomyces sp. NBC_01232]WSQ03802.1 hypothetical protein OG444_39635 [Streptomyces sp. NBC_01232]